MRRPTPDDPHTTRDLTDRLAGLERTCSRLTSQLRDAEGRAARAERSCEDAWRFAKSVLRTGRHLAE